MKQSPFYEYLKTQPEATQKALIQIRSYILEAVPDATETINYKIPAFALSKNGKRDKQIMIAGYKNHIGFYPQPDTIEVFLEELQDYKFSKGSVQFPLNKTIPKELIIKMVRYKKEKFDILEGHKS